MNTTAKITIDKKRGRWITHQTPQFLEWGGLLNDIDLRLKEQFPEEYCIILRTCIDELKKEVMDNLLNRKIKIRKLQLFVFFRAYDLYIDCTYRVFMPSQLFAIQIGEIRNIVGRKMNFL